MRMILRNNLSQFFSIRDPLGGILSPGSWRPLLLSPTAGRVGCGLIPLLTDSPQPPEPDGQVRRARKARDARAARLLTGRSGSSPPRAAGRLQRRPGHDSPPRPPAGARVLAVVRGLLGSSFGAGALGARAQGAECRPSALSQGTGLAQVARTRPGVPTAFAWGSLREGRDGEQSGAPWRLGGTPAGAGCRVARAFPELGARDSTSPAVTAGDVSASQRAEGTSVGAGFWASLELCPLSLHKKPNQKANLQASKPDVTLSAGRQPHRMTSYAYLAWGTEGRLAQRFAAGQGHPVRSPRAKSPWKIESGHKPYPEATHPVVEPWSLELRGRRQLQATRLDLDSPELEASRQEHSTGFPLVPRRRRPEFRN